MTGSSKWQFWPFFPLPLAQISAQGTYAKTEASFNITNLTTDPFDYTVTDVRVQILQPDNSTILLPAFFDGGTTWRVRQTPTMAGVYSISKVTMNGSPFPSAICSRPPGRWPVRRPMRVSSGWTVQSAAIHHQQRQTIFPAR